VSVAAAQKEYIQKFVEFYLENAPGLVEEVGYIPLPDEAYDAALARFQDRVKGSVFAGGSKVGVSITDLLRMEK